MDLHKLKLLPLFFLSLAAAFGQFPSFNSSGGSRPVGGLCAVQLYLTGHSQTGDNDVLCGVVDALTPAAPTVSVQGTPGADTWSYAVVAHNLIGTSVASANGTVANGAAVLGAMDFNRVTTPAVVGSTSCDIYITVAPVGGSTGLIDSGNACGAVFDDQTGLGDGTTPFATDLSTGLFTTNLHATGQVAFGNATLTPIFNVNVAYTQTLGNGGDPLIMFRGVYTVDPTPANENYVGLRMNVNSDGANVQNIGSLFSIDGTAFHDGDGDLATGAALRFSFVHDGAGIVTDAFGVDVTAAQEFSAAGTIVTAKGFHVGVPVNFGTITNNLGVDVEDQSSVGSTLALNIRSQGSDSVNSIEGRVTWGAHSFAGIGGLPTVNGDQIYCENCTVTSAIDNTCAGGGSGAQVFQLNGALKCFQ